MRSIPYGQSNFRKIIATNSYYVDKTSYIQKLEEAGSFLLFLRPRRFGKSLWVDTLSDYYDVRNAEAFGQEFAGLAAGEHPTPLHSKFLILRFDFSMVEKSGGIAGIKRSFGEYCCLCMSDFVRRYASLLPKVDVSAVNAMSNPNEMLEYLSGMAAACGQEIYVLIDEYDNFVNSVLSESRLGPDGYRVLSRDFVFFSNFFTFLKGGTSGSNRAIRRLFITGVSPLTLDDVTGGFNIGRNISTNPQFAGMLGFTEDEVRAMMEYYRRETGDATPVEERMASLRLWYDNYHFSDWDWEKTSVYNTDMVLYFFAEYVARGGNLPLQMVDNNVKTDYGKLRQLVFWDQKLNGNFSALCQLVEQNQVSAELVSMFGLENLGATDAFVSLLYYLGLVTIAGMDCGNVLFAIPNQTIRSMLYSYINSSLKELPGLNIDLQNIIKLVRGMGMEGKWEEALGNLAELTSQTLSVRDLVVREKGPQLIHLVYLGLPTVFIARCEEELSHGYADLILMPDWAHCPNVEHAYILEFKYLKSVRGRRPPKVAVEAAFQEAFVQLEGYRGDARIQRECGKARLHCIALVYCGAKLLGYREAEDSRA